MHIVVHLDTRCNMLQLQQWAELMTNRLQQHTANYNTLQQWEPKVCNFYWFDDPNTYTHKHRNKNTRAHTQKHMHACIFMYICIIYGNQIDGWSNICKPALPRTNTHLHIHIHTHPHPPKPTPTHTHTNTHTHTHSHNNNNTHTHINTHTRTYTDTHTQTHIHTHTHTQMHQHTQTNTHVQTNKQTDRQTHPCICKRALQQYLSKKRWGGYG